MPIHDYQCETCSARFEWLLRPPATDDAVTCASCGSRIVRRLISSFGVSSASIRSANIQQARKDHSKGLRDKQEAQAEHERHMAEHGH